MTYTIRMTPVARRSLYRISRGVVANVTAAISQLATVPIPYTAMAAGLPNTYLLAVAGHVIAYEVIESERVIVILWIGE
jgi:mRNA-degrading endonuclease RelE of RelBE toxin-antitoxin system